MRSKNPINHLLRFGKLAYLKLVRINDSDQKVAIGFGMGVFLGVMPGIGPVAALACALVFRVNRASALLGSLLTNTWLSVVTFIWSVKAGSAMTGLEWQKAYQDWAELLRGFHFPGLFKFSAVKIIFPVVLGYFVVSLTIGFLAYLFALLIIRNSKKIRYRKEKS